MHREWAEDVLRDPRHRQAAGLAPRCFRLATVYPALAKDRQVIAVELQGHGHTADIDRPLTYEQMADDIAALLKELKIEQADFFGYSMGGTVGLGVAIRHPKLVRKLAINGSHSGKMEDAYEPETAKQFNSLPADFAPPMLKDPYDKVAPDPKQWPTLVAKVKKMGLDFKGFTREELKSIKARVLITLGDRDGVRPEHAVEMFRQIPNASFAVFPGADHFLLWQSPEKAASDDCGVPRCADAGTEKTGVAQRPDRPGSRQAEAHVAVPLVRIDPPRFADRSKCSRLSQLPPRITRIPNPPRGRSGRPRVTDYSSRRRTNPSTTPRRSHACHGARTHFKAGLPRPGPGHAEFSSPSTKTSGTFGQASPTRSLSSFSFVNLKMPRCPGDGDSEQHEIRPRPTRRAGDRAWRPMLVGHPQRGA